MTKDIKQHKLVPNNSFLGVFTVLDDGRIKVEKAKRYMALNQYKHVWMETNSRNVARFINKGKLVIK